MKNKKGQNKEIKISIYKPELIGDKCCIQSGSFPLGLATFVTFLVQEIEN